ncbi:amidohydrolase family protein [Barrientosiimonas marina]|uniref:Amidohydrolase n=1 Tax=Lentibacillus kimchii TaxID=1542911 RepID=A0ABW2UVC8_9BACI
MRKLYYGGDIITMEKADDAAEAVLTENDIVKKVGRLTEFQDMMNDSSIEKIDLKGNTLMPGFVDPHSHISMVGQIASMADLSTCKTFNEIIQTLKLYMQNNGAGKEDYIIGFGYDHNILKEREHPKKDVLNQVSADNPIVIFHASGHMGCVNDAALKMAGIDENTPDMEGGHIGRKEETGKPDGYLEEGNFMSIQSSLPSDMGMDQLEAFNKGQEIYIRNGITTAQDGATSHETLELLKAVADQERLKLDVVAYPLVAENPEDIKNNEEYVKKYHNSLKIGGYKMFLDGSPQGRTAWLTEPYEGEESYCGYPRYQDEQVKEYVSRAINDGMQLLTHCNGDAASGQLLRNYESALQESDNPDKQRLRPVMIHCQTVRNDQLDKMAELSMIPSIFVSHTYYWGDVHLKNLGRKRGSLISPAESAFRKGLMVNFHQDSPIVKPDMLDAIWCGVNRLTRKGTNIGSEECVTVYEGLKAATINAAYSYFEEDQKGSIKEGKFADLVILDKNPLKMDKMKINEIQIEETIKEGKTIYKSESVLTE